MLCRETETGGRIVTGDTPYGRFRVEWDASGKLASESIEIRTPDTGPDQTPQTCAHGGDVMDRVKCKTCKGSVQIKVYACSIHGRCTTAKRVDGAARCRGCPDFTSR